MPLRKKRPIGTLTTILIALIVVVAVGATAVLLLRVWPFGRIVGSGNLVTEEMKFSDFTIVEVGSGFEVEITQSSSCSITITADDTVFDYVQVSKTGVTLDIGLKPGTYESLTLRAEITMPELHELELFGGVHGTIKGFSSSHKLLLGLSGGSSLRGDFKTSGDAKFALSGGSRITKLEGAANDLTISGSGGSHLALSDFPVHNANVNLSGGSHATINLDGRLDADISGGSNLYYISEPTMGEINESGGSEVSKR